MLRLLLLLLVALPASATAQVLPSFGSDRAGTSGFQFLKVPADPRGAALGETAVATAMDASALYWNPALSSAAGGTHIGFSMARYFANTRVGYVGGFRRIDALGGLTLGLSLHFMDSGEMDVHTEFSGANPTGQTFRLMNTAVGLSASQQLTDLFSYGVTAKWVQESVLDVSTNTALFDLGFRYSVGTTGAHLGVVIRNFGVDAEPSGELERLAGPNETVDVVERDGQEVVVFNDFSSITPPTTFLLGLSYDLLRANAQNDVTLSVQLTNPNDNRESYNVGAEYVWGDVLAFRTGYRFNADGYTTPSFGFGLMLPDLGAFGGSRFDYGFSRHDPLGSVHRIGLDLSL